MYFFLLLPGQQTDLALLLLTPGHLLLLHHILHDVFFQIWLFKMSVVISNSVIVNLLTSAGLCMLMKNIKAIM
jgi:hypothetical protein